MIQQFNHDKSALEPVKGIVAVPNASGTALESKVVPITEDPENFEAYLEQRVGDCQIDDDVRS